MKYTKDDLNFPILLHFYYEESLIELGDIEIYRTGKIYFKDFPINSGLNIKTIQKVLRIAKKELKKLK